MNDRYYFNKPPLKVRRVWISHNYVGAVCYPCSIHSVGSGNPSHLRIFGNLHNTAMYQLFRQRCAIVVLAARVCGHNSNVLPNYKRLIARGYLLGILMCWFSVLSLCVYQLGVHLYGTSKHMRRRSLLCSKRWLCTWVKQSHELLRVNSRRRKVTCGPRNVTRVWWVWMPCLL